MSSLETKSVPRRETPRPIAPNSQTTSYRLALGFGTTVLMWAIGYISRIPPVWVPSALLVALLLAAQILGGWCAGRFSPDGTRAGLWVGGVSALLNLLVMGSLLTAHEPNQIVPSALLWLPGSIAIGLACGAIGGGLGNRNRAGGPVARSIHPADHLDQRSWTSIFALVAATATFFLLIVGGVVTSQKAGLAVVDWPNSYGYMMFLYPLSKMSGGIYFEHAHRLFGSLVGLTTLVLTVHLWRVESRAWVKRFALGALVSVIVQGILGGLRVTGRFTLSDDPTQTAPNLALAVIHGVFGQVFFGMLVALAVVTAPAWSASGLATPAASRRTDQRLSAWFVSALIVQLVFGAILRHFSYGTLIHILMACVVFALGLVTALRAHASDHPDSLLRRLGGALLAVLTLQLTLGIAALGVTALAGGADPPPAYEVVVTTAHQATGAFLLALSVAHLVWVRRPASML
ncbi:MAG: COX15/CtaA family protein [Candidatus Eisenbacteria bacterium]|nr:COX15/CtaA family protein [Candidatus Eisenbacteria bacterium]